MKKLFSMCCVVAVMALPLSVAAATDSSAKQAAVEHSISRWLSCQQGDYQKAIAALKAARPYGVVSGAERYRLKAPVAILGETGALIHGVSLNAGQEELSWSWQTNRPIRVLLAQLGVKDESLREPDGTLAYSEWLEKGGPDGVLISIKTHPKRSSVVSCSYVRAW